jgi:hypothetical protein
MPAERIVHLRTGAAGAPRLQNVSASTPPGCGSGLLYSTTSPEFFGCWKRSASVPARRDFMSLVSLLGVVVAVHAQAADVTDPRACLTVEDRASRLECYDRALGRPDDPARIAGTPSVAATSGSSEALSAGTASPAPRTAEQVRTEFGLSESTKQARASRDRGQKGLESIEATVQRVDQRPTGERAFYMEDGQVWLELEAYSQARVRPGDVVTVRKASLASFMLVTSGRWTTRVRRIQ